MFRVKSIYFVQNICTNLDLYDIIQHQICLRSSCTGNFEMCWIDTSASKMELIVFYINKTSVLKYILVYQSYIYLKKCGIILKEMYSTGTL